MFVEFRKMNIYITRRYEENEIEEEEIDEHFREIVNKFIIF